MTQDKDVQFQLDLFQHWQLRQEQAEFTFRGGNNASLQPWRSTVADIDGTSVDYCGRELWKRAPWKASV